MSRHDAGWPAGWSRALKEAKSAAAQPLLWPPNASPTDPETSMLAGEAHEASGEAGRQREQVLAGVKKFPGRTSRELAQAMKADRHMVARRLPELRDRGLVVNGAKRVCQASKDERLAVTWEPAMPAVQSAECKVQSDQAGAQHAGE